VNGYAPGQITITRAGSAASALPVSFTLSGAVNGGDFTAVTSPVTIPAGSNSVTISITPIDHHVMRPTLILSLTLVANPRLYTIDSKAPAGFVEIFDDILPAVTVVATTPNAKEPSTPGIFTLSRTQNLSVPVSVYYSLTGSADRGVDYQPLSGNVVFAANQATAQVVVQPISDTTVYKGTRSLRLTVLPGVDYVDGTPGSDTVFIADAVGQPVRVYATVPTTQQGGTTPGKFSFLRDGRTDSPLTLNFNLTGAANGSACQTLPTSVTFPSGASEVTLSVTPISSAGYVGTQYVQLTLLTNSAYDIMPTMAAATVQILDNHLPTTAVPQSLTNQP
jgi:hypothetical protein